MLLKLLAVAGVGTQLRDIAEDAETGAETLTRSEIEALFADLLRPEGARV